MRDNRRRGNDRRVDRFRDNKPRGRINKNRDSRPRDYSRGDRDERRGRPSRRFNGRDDDIDRRQRSTDRRGSGDRKFNRRGRKSVRDEGRDRRGRPNRSTGPKLSEEEKQKKLDEQLDKYKNKDRKINS